MKDQVTIAWTGRVVREPKPRFFDLLEYEGTNEEGEPIIVYVYRIEKMEKAKEEFRDRPL